MHVFKEHFAKSEIEASWKFEEFHSEYQTLKEYSRQGENGEHLHKPVGMGLFASIKCEPGSDQFSEEIMKRINSSWGVTEQE